MKRVYILILFMTILNLGNTQIYVDIDATGSNDGTSWTDAYNDLQDAIDAANVNDEIWVAAGTYLPTKDHTGNNTPADNRDKSFHFATDMQIYGGFNGTETLLSQRNSTTNVTILSGDFNGDDVVTGGGSTLSFSNNTENAYKVWITINLTSATVIEGFTISGGNANGAGSVVYQTKTFNQDRGGGMHGINSSPTLTNLIVKNNNATNDGGGIFNNTSSSPTITNSTFTNNNATDGGGIRNVSSSPTISNSTFTNNNATTDGGGMSNFSSSSPMISNSTFTNNNATNNGGGIHNVNSSSPTIINSIFVNNNAANKGGGMRNFSSSPTITNSTFTNNNATNSGGAIDNESTSNPTIVNTIFWDNIQQGASNIAGADIQNTSSTPTVTYCITQENSLYSSGTGILNNQNPLFTDAANNDFSLQASSPAINAGDGAEGGSANTTSLDLAGNPRFNGVIDLGAYEKVGVLPVELLYFGGYATETGNILNWETASEKNNDGFEVQRSANGRNWELLDFIAGAGTTVEFQTYNYLDKAPLNGKNYYRLKQVDFDNQFEYTNIVQITNEQLTHPKVNIFPNPARHYFNIESNDLEEQIIQIFNINGQLVKEITSLSSTTYIPISELQNGSYFIKVGEIIKPLVIIK